MPFDLSQDLNQRKQSNLFRENQIALSAQGPRMVFDLGDGKKEYLTFCSNDYLGLANHPDIKQTFQNAANEFGVGSGAAHLVNGHSYHHQKLEEDIAQWTGREAALLFSTGYMANLGAINALLNKEDAIFQDKWNHASLLDGGLLCGARFQRYLHNDMANLEIRLKRSHDKQQIRRTLIVTDGVFSMDGDIAPLTEISKLAHTYDAWTMVDDAHGLGVLGNTGAGICEALNLSQKDVPILMGTLGKGVGTAGAFVAGSKELIEYLTNFARPYIYTTAMPAALAAATSKSIEIIKGATDKREHLQNLIKQFRQGALDLGLSLMDSTSGQLTELTAIQPILIGDTEQALNISQQLKQKGIMVTAIRPPTVPVGTSRLRITLSASHDSEMVNQLLDALKAIIKTDNQS